VKFFYVKFHRIQSDFEEISMLSPFTAHCVGSVDDITYEYVGINSMTFQECSNQDFEDGNDEKDQTE
jgi:hypothetical protein